MLDTLHTLDGFQLVALLVLPVITYWLGTQKAFSNKDKGNK